MCLSNYINKDFFIKKKMQRPDHRISRLPHNFFFIPAIIKSFFYYLFLFIWIQLICMILCFTVKKVNFFYTNPMCTLSFNNFDVAAMISI